jgi:peptidoglycan hydrolase CwlO-like protein
MDKEALQAELANLENQIKDEMNKYNALAQENEKRNMQIIEIQGAIKHTKSLIARLEDKQPEARA